MDWANEEYVRLYTRETADDIDLSWEALALWRAMLPRFDRAGVIIARSGWASVSRLVRMPTDVVERAGPELIKDGRVKQIDGGLFAPNYVEAQTASKSDKARQRESRDRRRARASSQIIESVDASHTTSQAVTQSHEPSQNVTLCSALLCDPVAEAMRCGDVTASPPSALDQLKDKCDAVAGDAEQKPEPKAKRGRRIPDDWKPREQERAVARELELDCDAEAREFFTYWKGEGKTKIDWDWTFHNRLIQQARRRPRARGTQTPLEAQLERVRMLEEQERNGANS